MKPMRTFLLSILLVTLAAAPAAANDNDLLGLYFDPWGYAACAEGVMPFTQLTQYLVLSNPTMDAVYGYECGITVSGAPAQLLGHQTPCGISILPFELAQIQVGCATPVAVQEHTVLLSLDWFYLAANCEMVLFELHDARNPTLPTGTPLLQVNNNELIPVAVDRLQYVPATSAMTGMFDVCYPLANDEQTWGGLKALYR